MDEVNARGVPAELQYVVRHESGAELPTRMIVLQELRFASDSNLGMFDRGIPPDALLHGSIWSVFIAPEVVSRLKRVLSS